MLSFWLVANAAHAITDAILFFALCSSNMLSFTTPKFRGQSSHLQVKLECSVSTRITSRIANVSASTHLRCFKVGVSFNNGQTYPTELKAVRRILACTYLAILIQNHNFFFLTVRDHQHFICKTKQALRYAD